MEFQACVASEEDREAGGMKGHLRTSYYCKRRLIRGRDYYEFP